MSIKSYDEYRNFAEEHLMDYIPEIDHKSITLYDSMKYSITSGGKRLRPVLLLASCEFSGGTMVDALPYACALEYIHTYSLIHDDLPAMDNDDFRRGNPTNHRVFGDAIAILAGDGLLNSAYEIMNMDMLMYFDNPIALKKRICASYEISKGSGVRGMVAGQVADIEAQGHSCSKEMLDYIHLNKTAALIVSAIRAGAYIGGADSERIEALTAYGENLGLLFQITDDILDVTGDSAEMGKATGADAKNNKSTYISVYNLEKTKQRAINLADNAKKALSNYGKDAQFYIDIVDKVLIRTK
ncbi:MAG: polyprenyl synthetase family protein [Clostridiales bacterium]|nr:polyprenyl synthetase family protein [Clostridiales bacterium]MDD6390387.1 polyprenyl synthetase family protein [Bacillota bacterium]MDY5976161.1 farnesyl diphosphate synthase [Anaerovoracaceae bacterium]